MIAVALAVSVATATSADAASSVEELRARLAAAWNADDRGAFLSLFNWEGAHDDARAGAEGLFDQYGGQALERIDLEPAQPGINDGMVANGIRYRPNVDVRGSLKVVLAGSANPSINFGLPWGRAGNSVWIASVIQEPVEAATGPADRQLAIEIFAQMSPTKLDYEVSCTVVVSGQRETARYRGSGALTRFLPGQHVESCSIEKLGGAGWIDLRVRVDGELVFESGRNDLTEPLHYEGG